MLNNAHSTVTDVLSSTQILADVTNQKSVGCIVAQALGVAVGDKRIAKAGTPIKIDFLNLQTPAVLGTASVAMNAVLLHDVDVTAGANNGTALIFGFVNINRLEADVQTKLTAAVGGTGASPLIEVLKV